MKKEKLKFNTFGYSSTEEKEEYIFRNASHYRVTDCGTAQTGYFHTYPEALSATLGILDQENGRALLYVISTEGRDFCMPRDQFQKYLSIYNDLTEHVTGQRLGMPKLKLNPKTKG
jgi:hypothetical protein